MRIPFWLTLVAAVFVTVFGVFRIRVALKQADQRRYGMGKRMHLFMGTIYVLFGVALFAVSFGWNPFGNYFAVDSKSPPKDEAPQLTPVPRDQLPTKK